MGKILWLASRPCTKTLPHEKYPLYGTSVNADYYIVIKLLTNRNLSFLKIYCTDDWRSIYGDPTKFSIGVIIVGCELLHLAQRYVIFRGAMMKEYDLPMACTCAPGRCRCKATFNRRKSIDKVSDTVALPDGKLQLKGLTYV